MRLFFLCGFHHVSTILIQFDFNSLKHIYTKLYSTLHQRWPHSRIPDAPEIMCRIGLPTASQIWVNTEGDMFREERSDTKANRCLDVVVMGAG